MVVKEDLFLLQKEKSEVFGICFRVMNEDSMQFKFLPRSYFIQIVYLFTSLLVHQVLCVIWYDLVGYILCQNNKKKLSI